VIHSGRDALWQLSGDSIFDIKQLIGQEGLVPYAERRTNKAREAGSTHFAPLTRTQFESSPGFANFRPIMKRLLAVPKAELDARIRAAKEASPRAGNPKAAGRKKESSGIIIATL
jgi:hypothetical protein